MSFFGCRKGAFWWEDKVDADEEDANVVANVVVFVVIDDGDTVETVDEKEDEEEARGLLVWRLEEVVKGKLWLVDDDVDVIVVAALERAPAPDEEERECAKDDDGNDDEATTTPTWDRRWRGCCW